MNEEWRAVPSAPKYEVSSLGRIKRAVASKGARVGQILTSHQYGRGYPMVGIWSGNRRRLRTVHSLVAEAFIGPRPPGMDVNHKDGNKSNPAVENLEYVTRSENAQHAVRTGLKVAPCGEASASSKLTTEIVLAIRNDAATMTYQAIARKYGIDQPRVSRICRGALWASVGGPIWPRRRRGNNQYQTILPALPVTQEV